MEDQEDVMTTEAAVTGIFNDTDKSENDTLFYPKHYMWDNKPLAPPLLTLLWSTLMIVGVLGNLGFIYVRARVPYMRTLTNYYLVNLGIADTIYLLAQVPGEIRNLYHDDANSLWAIESYCLVMNTISYPCQYASLFTITVIAFERYFAICQPFKMSGVYNTKSRALKFIALTWVMGILVSLPFFFTCGPTTNALLSALLVVRLATFAPCMLIVAVLYILIGIQLNKRTSKPGGKDEQVRKERKQVVRMLVVTAAVFFICLTPYQVYALYMSFVVMKKAPIVPFNVGLMFFSVNKTLIFLNSAANPAIYNALSSKYRVAFKEAFGPLCFCLKSPPKHKYYYDNTNHTVVTM
ncbi:neuromedin-U receptor 2-like [Ptychodera flava]|uniref:neuromedin-U receptor 2-like n=1 Tax=Ptychodera flava TaxID=63121 RepID=UPI003969C51F